MSITIPATNGPITETELAEAFRNLASIFSGLAELVERTDSKPAAPAGVKPQKQPENVEEVALDLVKDALKQVMAQPDGKAKVAKILQDNGAGKLRELSEDKYAAVYKEAMICLDNIPF